MASNWQLSSNWWSGPHRRRSSEDLTALSTPSSTDEVPLRRWICERFMAAYNGRHTKDLHGDKPIKEHFLFSQDYCTLLISTSQGSQLLIAPAEFTRYKYRPFSEDPSIKIRFGHKIENPDTKQDGFIVFAALEIHTDQLTAPVVRKFIPAVTPSSLRQALKGTIGGIADEYEEIEAVLEKLRTPCAENGVNCMTFAISKGDIWIRYSKPQMPCFEEIPCSDETPCSNEMPCSLTLSLESQLLEIKHITVIRRAEKKTLDIGDRLWDCMVQRCLRDGVFWAYGQPKYNWPRLPLRKQVGNGKLAAPNVSWCRWDNKKWKEIVDRSKMIEVERKAWEVQKCEDRMRKVMENSRGAGYGADAEERTDCGAKLALNEWDGEERGQWSHTNEMVYD